MIRVRFHGRGGQGMKTASRILGTAALLDGLQAQDSPVYGAERRGAPMAAYTRIAEGPIVERGVIPAPDLVVVADDTLLDDPGARPLAGLPPDGGLLVATAHSADEVRRHTGHPGPVVARDFLALALAEVGSAAAVSAALGAAACALLGLSEAAAAAAVRAELEALELPRGAVDANARLAAGARTGLAPLALPRQARAPAPGARVVEVVYAPPEVGAPTVTARANTPLRKTGSWRLFRPVIDLARCTRCWICFVRCPEGAIDLDPDDTPRIDYEVCKGCLICVEECPIHCIATVRELREWAESGARP
ncbi:MAG: 2-oxoacid:acceptor oxidoreductase family protein [Candidatus Rokubacteria bacterium]|nr:2-oxoacid:acceptor oxidoreductase family protein [Candidatus Rokubacteria bacterium]